MNDDKQYDLSDTMIWLVVMCMIAALVMGAQL